MDEMDIYMEKLRETDCPRFSKAEERELSKLKDQGDEEARMKLIHSCLPLVVNLARRWMGHPEVKPMDIIQEGNIGLMIAVDKFDPEQYNARLTTYAGYWINQKMRRFMLGERGGVIHLPYAVAAGAPVRGDEVLQDRVDKLMQGGIVPLQEAMTEDNEPEEEGVGQIAADKDEYNYKLGRLFDLIDALDDPRERFIVKERMLPGNTLKRVGEMIGLTRERVRQIEIKAEEKLKVLQQTLPWKSNGKGAMNDETFVKHPPTDPIEILDRLTVAQVQAQIDANKREFVNAQTRYHDRAKYLRKLKELIMEREGLAPDEGAQKSRGAAAKKSTKPTTSRTLIKNFLRGKEKPQAIGTIMACTGLTKQQVAVTLSKNPGLFRAEKNHRWSLVKHG